MDTQSCVACDPDDCWCYWYTTTQVWDSVYGTDYDAIIQHYREVENSGPETINYVPRMQLLR